MEKFWENLEHEMERFERFIGTPAWFDTLGKYPLSEEQIRRISLQEMPVHGIPVAILARANLFSNDPNL